jgi:hypothetical protein
MSPTGELSPRSRAARRWWIVPILAFLALATWSVSSPVGSSPDDDFHLASIWCGSGIRAGICETAPQPTQRLVPTQLVKETCYAGDATRSAACQNRGDRSGLTATSRGNFNGQLYPPVFYAAMSVFVGPDIDASVVGMRLVNSALFVGLMTGLWVLLPRRRRSTLVWAAAITTIPLGIFLIASINPSGWAILSAATLWIAVLGFYETPGRRRWGLAAIAMLATVIGAGARADAALFAAVGIGVAVILAFARTRRFLLDSLLPLGLLVIAGLLYRLGSQSGAGSTGLNGTPPPDFLAAKKLVLQNLLDIPDLWAGSFGRWGLGWLDTRVPNWVWFSGIALFAVAVAIGLSSSSVRKYLVVGLVGLAAVLFPLVLQVQTQVPVGAYIQPRYVLPLVVLFAGVVLLRMDAPFPRLHRVHIVAGIAILSAANAISLYTNIRRYVTGTTVVGINLDAGDQWWWPGAPGPMYLWIAGVAVYTVLIVLLARPMWDRAVAARALSAA